MLLKKCIKYQDYLINDLTILLNKDISVKNAPKRLSESLTNGKFDYDEFMRVSGVNAANAPGAYFSGEILQNSALVQGCTKLEITRTMISLLQDYPVYSQANLTSRVLDHDNESARIKFLHMEKPIPPIPSYVCTEPINNQNGRTINGPFSDLANIAITDQLIGSVPLKGTILPLRLNKERITDLGLSVPSPETKDSMEARMQELFSYITTDIKFKLCQRRNKNTSALKIENTSESPWLQFIFEVKMWLGIKTTGEALADDIKETISIKPK